jgi:hypothetical protein
MNTENEQNQTNPLEPDEATERYLETIEAEMYSEISIRKRIFKGLLFFTCQTASVSLSWFLFNLQLSQAAIHLIAGLIAIMPGLINLGDGFNADISSEGWNLKLGENPLMGLGQIAVGVAIHKVSTESIDTAFNATRADIESTYRQISVNTTPNMLATSLVGWLILITAFIGGIGFVLRKR